MRLICPNCGAQYEVPDEVIPENGRDVQCSNCGDTWFQNHPDHPYLSEASPEAEYGPEDAPDWTEEEDALPDPAPETTPEPGPDPDAEFETEPEIREDTDTGARRGIDPDVASVLREEASRERQAREAETRGGVETQPDLGLTQAEDDDGRRKSQARSRMARLRGMAPPEEETMPDEADLDPGSRRGLLPDIEDIKSSITEGASAEKRDRSARDGSKNAPKPAPRPGGFRRGLRLSIGLALIGVAIYVFAPQISNAVPAAAGPLSGYVNTVNDIRVTVNDQIAAIVVQVQALIGG